MSETHPAASASLDAATRATLLRMQRAEITEHHIYARLAARVGAGPNREILERISADERRHAEIWARYTGRSVAPSRVMVWFYSWVSRLLGLTFGLKLMERGEERAQRAYGSLGPGLPPLEEIEREESEHERALLALLDEDHLRYVSSIVLGLNDALIELTGALAGLTLALQHSRLIAMTGLITGLAAALSMAASEYLSTKSEGEGGKSPVRAALYTGSTYVATVALLILPYLTLEGTPVVSLSLTLSAAIAIVAAFTFYSSVVRDEPFCKRFLEMAGLSLGVAGISFIVGFLVRRLLGVDL